MKNGKENEDAMPENISGINAAVEIRRSPS
jgi:hypothetical protein